MNGGAYAPRVFGCLAILLLALPACERSRRYESAVQIVSKVDVEKDEAGKALQVDLEVEWDACPGDQFQVIRGDKEFAACVAKYEAGDYAPVLVRHFWDPRGYYRWDIERFGDCARGIEPDSPGSYEKSQECKDITNYGKTAGFECSRKPFRQLLQRCPWMARD